MSAYERTGWRCQAISGRHRVWGYNCPAVDLDFVVAEYNYGRPVALIEYKDRHAQINTSHPTYDALRALADGYTAGQLPFLVAVYCPDDWWFRVIPLNDASRRHYRSALELSEQRFVRSLYLLRKRVLDVCDEQAIARLNTVAPPLAKAA